MAEFVVEKHIAEHMVVEAAVVQQIVAVDIAGAQQIVV